MKKKYFLLLISLVVFSVSAQIVNIPDPNFKNALIGVGVDANNDGEIQVSEAEDRSALTITYSNVVDVTGIEAFVNLVVLELRGNEITSIDLSSLTQLSTLDLGDNAFSNVDLTNNTSIWSLWIDGNQLTTLDVSNLSELITLRCSFNQLSSIDLSNNPNLDLFSCWDNNITSLDLSNNTNLSSLNVQANQLTSLDVSNTSMFEINCAENQLTNLTLNDCVSSVVCYDNALTTLQFPNANCVSYLECQNNQLTTLEFADAPDSWLNYINCNNNQLTSLDVSNLNDLSTFFANDNNLETLAMGNNQDFSTVQLNNNQLTNLSFGVNTGMNSLYVENNVLTSLDLSNVSDLNIFSCSGNQLQELDLSAIPGLGSLDCSNNQLNNIDVSMLESLGSFDFSNNPELSYIILKNGRNGFYSVVNVEEKFADLPNLQTVCVDDIDSTFAQSLMTFFGDNTVITTYCSFVPGGEYFVVQGTSYFDLDDDGCDDSDSIYPLLHLNITNGSNSAEFFSNTTGNYTIPLENGNYTIIPQLENSTYFSVAPNPVSVNFPSDSSPYEQDFCITANGTYNDLEVIIVPLDIARPGFDTDYKLLYKNKGTTQQSGSVSIAFDDNFMEVLTSSPAPASQSTGSLSWDYVDLMPLETREVLFTMTLNTPTNPDFPLNSGDLLEFTSNIDPIASDETPEDNTFILNQSVVNSFDPNDKTCLEGNVIAQDYIGEYIHYLIRFENTGTANAVNVVIRDIIDPLKYNVSTLTPLDGSHAFSTRIQNSNEVEFIFENINLPFDDANNDGYVLFKIRILPSLVLGDSFSNNAEIYFDFNAPILTNLETTVIQDNLSIEEYDLSNNISVFPNPIDDVFSIKTADNIIISSLNLYDVSGKSLGLLKASEQYNIRGFESGVYFVQIETNKGVLNIRLIKN